ncbi:tetratricopeptide repeat protein [Pelagibius litoralis]|uniref:Tetratricopeptide repeat protein n=1 Tax=Pelagibius litoralis TaxID=374515 RepID=A0A967CCH9_9PROT|nr:tetratricopeptide repeat protein [Pelagibius litoralis]NIA69088.1 tetratricopeptide repeat protein [Pelagibius litoralis]
MLFSLFAALPSAADQNDARLEKLFDRLLEAPGPAEAQAVEGAIWSIWAQSDDGAVRALMEDGVAAMSRRDYRRALSKFEQMVAIAPDFAEGWNKRATVHYLMGRYDQSLADVARTLALEPRHFGALSGRGLIYVALEDEKRALDSFEEALVIHPNLISAAINAEALRKILREREI